MTLTVGAAAGYAPEQIRNEPAGQAGRRAHGRRVCLEVTVHGAITGHESWTWTTQPERRCPSYDTGTLRC